MRSTPPVTSAPAPDDGVDVRLSKADLAERTGYAVDGGGFQNAIGRLRTLCLVDGRSDLRLATELLGGGQ